MARSDKPIGDLEYEKFDEDTDGSVSIKFKEQNPFNHLKATEKEFIILESILKELRLQTKYLKNLFQGDIL